MPINPCGMGVDLIRSCYETKMRFWEDLPTEVGVRWFFCADDAKVFPESTRFGSGNWASDKFDWPGPGEVLGAPRPWRDGATPDGFDGHKFCGRVGAFVAGATEDDEALNTDVDGRCCCCDCDCECDDLVTRFADLITIQITAASGGGGTPLFHLGQTFLLHKYVVPGSTFWETDWIPTPGSSVSAIKLRTYCFEWFGLGRLITLGRVQFPDVDPVQWVLWIKEGCEPSYTAEVFDYFLADGANVPETNLRLTAHYAPNV